MSTSYFQQVKDLRERQRVLDKELTHALYGARHFEAIPWDILAAESGKSRTTVKTLVAEEQERLQASQGHLRGVRRIDVDMLDTATIALIAPALVEE